MGLGTVDGHGLLDVGDLLCEIDDGLWLVHFGAWELGLLNDRALERGLLPRLMS